MNKIKFQILIIQQRTARNKISSTQINHLTDIADIVNDRNALVLALSHASSFGDCTSLRSSLGLR